MATPTTRYNLLKPSVGEAYNVQTLNDNYDKIDVALPKFTPGNKPFGHMGRTQGIQSVNNATYALVGFTAAQILHGGMTFANNALIVPATGYYRISVKGNATGGTPPYTMYYTVYLNGTDLQHNMLFYKGSTDDAIAHSNMIYQLNALDKLTLYTKSTPAGSSSCSGTTGYDGVYLEVEWLDQ